MSRAEKFADRLNSLRQRDNSFDTNTPGTVRALSNFLGTAGDKVASLSRTSRNKLLNQTDSQAQQMRTNAIEEVTKKSKAQIKNVLDQYAQGKISHGQLSKAMTGIVKRQALASAIIGVRGVGNLTENVLTAVKRQLSVQLAYLDGFLEDIQTRTVSQKDRARAAQYANAAWSISQTAARQFNLDMAGTSPTNLEERRRLGGAEHCDDCVELADEWQPFGVLPVPGQGTVCGSSCQCTMEVRPVSEETREQSQTTSENPVKQDG